MCATCCDDRQRSAITVELRLRNLEVSDVIVEEVSDVIVEEVSAVIVEEVSDVITIIGDGSGHIKGVFEHCIKWVSDIIIEEELEGSWFIFFTYFCKLSNYDVTNPAFMTSLTPLL